MDDYDRAALGTLIEDTVSKWFTDGQDAVEREVGDAVIEFLEDRKVFKAEDED